MKGTIYSVYLDTFLMTMLHGPMTYFPGDNIALNYSSKSTCMEAVLAIYKPHAQPQATTGADPGFWGVEGRGLISYFSFLAIISIQLYGDLTRKRI